MCDDKDAKMKFDFASCAARRTPCPTARWFCTYSTARPLEPSEKRNNIIGYHWKYHIFILISIIFNSSFHRSIHFPAEQESAKQTNKSMTIKKFNNYSGLMHKWISKMFKCRIGHSSFLLISNTFNLIRNLNINVNQQTCLHVWLIRRH